MEIIGKIIFDLGETSGTSKAGREWKKHEYVLETQESYPRKVHFDFFGDKADQYKLAAGQMIKLSFDIDSREYNGRWFTSISGWKAEPATVAATGAPSSNPLDPPATPAAPDFQAVPPTDLNQSEPNDDLPF
ncbi:MAG: DUF3127 domain-containing protein [Muribaculaceae bacterium]|nr:DUF3127 domain-containing protein [Muribaculaceae bacterium]MDE5844022.1 DUF3127 domain-containing protein [Muribaculaceae bacterium]